MVTVAVRRALTLLWLVAGAGIVVLLLVGRTPPYGDGASRLPGDDAPAASGAPALPDGVPPAARPATVISITDGDTLRADVDGADEPVRLLEIDTPEVTGDCGAGRATAALARLAPVGSRVWLEADVEGRDRYDRLLRYVWRDDGTMLNRTLVRRGWARATLYPPNEHHWPLIRRAERRARARDAGLWARCGWGAAAARTPPRSAPRGSPSPGCDNNYTGCVPPYPPDVDCDSVNGPVTVLGADPHSLDGDGDGRACEPPPT